MISHHKSNQTILSILLLIAVQESAINHFYSGLHREATENVTMDTHHAAGQ